MTRQSTSDRYYSRYTLPFWSRNAGMNKIFVQLLLFALLCLHAGIANAADTPLPGPGLDWSVASGTILLSTLLPIAVFSGTYNVRQKRLKIIHYLQEIFN